MTVKSCAKKVDKILREKRLKRETILAMPENTLEEKIDKLKALEEYYQKERNQ